MSDSRYVTGTISSLERLKSSANGNPNWRIVLTDGRSLDTYDDTQLGYVIQNPEYQDTPLRFLLSSKGKVMRAERVEDLT